jgi:hypothetical protein
MKEDRREVRLRRVTDRQKETLEIEPRTSITKHPPEQFAGDATTTWLDHTTDEDDNGR